MASACTSEKEKIDLLVTNATIYTVNDAFENAEAMAVIEGKVYDVGTTEELSNKYQATNSIQNCITLCISLMVFICLSIFYE